MLDQKSKYRSFPKFIREVSSNYLKDLSISTKIRHWSEKAINALRYVSISGRPYPVRSEKRILQGEDDAFFTESVKEVLNNTTGDTEIIQQVKLKNWKDEYSTIKSSLSNFYRPDLFEKLSGFFYYKFTGDAWKGTKDSSEVFANIREFSDPLDKQEIEMYQAYIKERDERGKELAEKKNKIGIQRTEDLWNAEIEKARRVGKIETDANEKIYKEKQRHDEKAASLLVEWKSGIITRSEYLTLSYQEDEKFSNNNEEIRRKENSDIDIANKEYKVKKITIEYDADKQIYDLNKEYDEWNTKTETDYYRTVEENDEQIALYATSQLNTISRVYFSADDFESYSIARLDFNKRKYDAVLKKSCSDKFFEKYIVFAPSSTPQFGLYADMDRMRFRKMTSTMFRRSSYAAIHDDGYVWYVPELDPYTFADGDASIQYKSGAKVIESSGQLSDWDWNKKQYTNKEYNIYLGDKLDFDDDGECLIDYVVAYVIIRRYSYQENRRLKEKYDLHEKFVEDIKKDPQYQSLYNQGSIWWEDGMIKGSTTKNMDRIIYQYNEDKEKIKSIFYPSYSKEIRRVVFYPQYKYSEKEIAQISEWQDSRDDSLIKVEEEIAKKKNEIESQFMAQIDSSGNKYEESIEKIEDDYKNDTDSITRTFVSKCLSSMAKLNEDLYFEKDKAKIGELRTKFEKEVLFPAQSKMATDKAKAYQDYNSSKNEKRQILNEEITQFKEQERIRIREVTSSYAEIKNKINTECSKKIDDLYSKNYAKIAAAKKITDNRTKYEELNRCEEILVSNRMKFTASIEPDREVSVRGDCDVYTLDDRVEGVTEIIAHYGKRRCSTGVDFTDWYAATDSE